VTYSESKYDKTIILDVTDDAVITNPVPPKAT
jgi:hypothetical protein